jgi:hypothetical protein
LKQRVRDWPEIRRTDARFTETMSFDVLPELDGDLEDQSLVKARRRRSHEELAMNELVSRYRLRVSLDESAELVRRPTALCKSRHTHKMLGVEMKLQVAMPNYFANRRSCRHHF